MISSFEENIYNKYLSQLWSKPYQCAGIYGITINNLLVYIGKSKNILFRMAQHRARMITGSKAEHKYTVFHEALSRKMRVRFLILYRAGSHNGEALEEELGREEGYFIRKCHPALNTQIPHEDNWRKFDIDPAASKITLDDILGKYYM